MMRSWWLACAIVAAAPGQHSWAAADDEPVKGRLSIELRISPNGVTLKFEAEAIPPEPTPAIDAVCPSIVSAYMQALLQRMRMDLPAAKESAAPDPETLFREMRQRTIPLGLATQATY